LESRRIGGREKDNPGSFLLQPLPCLPPVHVETNLDSDGAEIGLENGRIEIAWEDAVLKLSFRGLDLVVLAGNPSLSVHENG